MPGTPLANARIGWSAGVSGSRYNKLSGTLRAKAATAITADNYRDYPEQAVRRVNMVRQLKDLGFSLREICDVLDALRKDTLDCAQGAEQQQARIS